MLETKKSYWLLGMDDIFLSLFNPEFVSVLYEPGQSRKEPPLPRLHGRLPTITLSRPELEFEHFGREAEKYYFPTYTLEEMLAIARDIRESARTAMEKEECEALYSDAKVEERFGKYGGIFPMYFPSMRRERGSRTQSAYVAP